MKFFSSFVLILFAFMTFGQQTSVKLNLFSLTLKNISPRVEYAFNDNMSAELSLGFMLPRNAGIINSLVDFTSSDGKFDVDPEFRFNGFSATPSFRYYFGDKGPMAGFYINPYLQYYNYKIGSTTAYAGQILDLDFISTGIGGGFGLGYQWVLNSGFTIDWFFIGGGAAYNKIVSRFKPQGNTDLNQLKNDAVIEFEHWYFENLGEQVDVDEDIITIDNDVLKFGLGYTGLIGRIGFSLGYAF